MDAETKERQIAELAKMETADIQAQIDRGRFKSGAMKTLAHEELTRRRKAEAQERADLEERRHQDVIEASRNEAQATREGNQVNVVFGWGGWVLAFAQFAWDVGKWALE